MGQEPVPENASRQVPFKFVLTIAVAITGMLAVWAPSAIACPGGRVGAANLTVAQARTAEIGRAHV